MEIDNKDYKEMVISKMVIDGKEQSGNMIRAEDTMEKQQLNVTIYAQTQAGENAESEGEVSKTEVSETGRLEPEVPEVEALSTQDSEVTEEVSESEKDAETTEENAEVAQDLETVEVNAEVAEEVSEVAQDADTAEEVSESAEGNSDKVADAKTTNVDLKTAVNSEMVEVNAEVAQDFDTAQEDSDDAKMQEEEKANMQEVHVEDTGTDTQKSGGRKWIHALFHKNIFSHRGK